MPSPARLLPVLVALLIPIAAQAQSLIGNPSLDAAAATMRPGQYRFDLDRPAPGFDTLDTGGVEIAVSIAMQRLYVYRGGELVAVATISTGKPGKRTPLGDFTILQKARFHRSNIYSNAPMPFMQRLTWTGIAIHAGHLPGYPASHGCIRVPMAFAQALFGLTALGNAVKVADWPPHTPVWLDVAWADLGLAEIATPPSAGDRTIRLDYDVRVLVFDPPIR